MSTKSLRASVSVGALLFFVTLALAETRQIDVHSVLNARSVTTLTAGKLIPWTKGIDGGGRADGYMTLEAALFNGDKSPKALPGDGVFPATPEHPDIRLNFSNTDGSGSQSRSIEGASEFEFAVPPMIYRSMMLFLTSAEGASHLSVSLTYADGSKDEQTVVLPDYYNDASANDPVVFSLAKDLAKWNASGRMAEANHHFIHGVKLEPSQHKLLAHVRVQKSAPAYLVFWGATGLTAE